MSGYSSAEYDAKLPEITQWLRDEWDKTCIPTLQEYIKIPNQSPSYDPDERKNGLTEKAMHLLMDWAKGQGVEGCKMELHEEEGRTPLLVLDIDARGAAGPEGRGTMLMYGHMDKQPPMTGWDAELGGDEKGPWNPVIRDGKLYGRGGADDGYAICACVTSVRALQRAGLPHGRCVIIVEACEESGSPDLPHWITKLRAGWGDIDFIICTDSGCMEFDTMYLTTTLRGVVMGTLDVSLLGEGVHSGIFGGIVPDSFLVANQILARVQDTRTGKVTLPALNPFETKSGAERRPDPTNAPGTKKTYTKQQFTDFYGSNYGRTMWRKAGQLAAEKGGGSGKPDYHTTRKEFDYIDKLPGKAISGPVPLQPGVKLPGKQSDLAFANAWLANLTVTGANLPAPSSAGNVLRPVCTLKLSMRIPPTVDAKVVAAALKKELERDPPFGAKVTYNMDAAMAGWKAPDLVPWVKEICEASAQCGFKESFRVMGIGGSIPFMGMLGELYPAAQFAVTGVLGPKTNAHGPNEFLHIEYTKKFVVGMTRIVYGHALAPRK